MSERLIIQCWLMFELLKSPIFCKKIGIKNLFKSVEAAK